MFKTHPVHIGGENHALAGNLVLPDAASAGSPVPGVVMLGGPGPVPLSRYTDEGARQWPVIWSEALGAAGLAALCYDQRGSGLSSGAYYEADWVELLDDARAAAEMLRVQPEVSRTAAVAWADGSGFALTLAAEGLVDVLVLLAPAYFTAEERYRRSVAALAAGRGLSERVVKLRVEQWQAGIAETERRVAAGETSTVTDLGGGRTVVTNLRRFLQATQFDPAPVVQRVRVPVLLMHGEGDNAISAAESAAMADALGPLATRLTYPEVGHFLYREERARTEAVGWVARHLKG